MYLAVHVCVTSYKLISVGGVALLVTDVILAQ